MLFLGSYGLEYEHEATDIHYPCVDFDCGFLGGSHGPVHGVDGDSIHVADTGIRLQGIEIRSSSTDDVACWFIDTNYNGESFFVRHAYFTGADEPYNKLKRALRADIAEDVWESLYSTVSRPFDRPESGRLAVKVINHYGDEVLKVIDV